MLKKSLFDIMEGTSALEFCFYVKAEALTLRQPVSIFSDVIRRNPMAANQSPAFSCCLLPAADRPQILRPNRRERDARHAH